MLIMLYAVVHSLSQSFPSLCGPEAAHFSPLESESDQSGHGHLNQTKTKKQGPTGAWAQDVKVVGQMAG